MDNKPKIGISSCLLGEAVRYDGGHKRFGFCTEVLSRYVDYVPLCPEMGIGLGTPRPTIRLVRAPGAVTDNDRIIARSSTGIDHTEALTAFANRHLDLLRSVSGYIFCAKSPSCGMERVPVYNDNNTSAGKIGVGIFARTTKDALPHLPTEENGRLNDEVLRENFITRVYVYWRWQQLRNTGLTAADLVSFHSANKYLVLAHNTQAYQRLGKLVADLQADKLDNIANRYIHDLMGALSTPASRGQHTNVLQHIQGYFKKQLSAEQKQRLSQTIEQYRLEILPLMAPITLLNHYLAEFPNPYLSQQYYLKPFPETLNLRYSL